MAPFGDQRHSANVAIWRLGHVVCFSDVYYPILRHIVANKGDILKRKMFLTNKPENCKKNRKKMLFSRAFSSNFGKRPLANIGKKDQLNIKIGRN